jgi:hypothetical protein
MQAYLHFGTGNEPRQTIATEARESVMFWQAAGLTWTATGYGARIPSHYMVKFEGRWRRVYIARYGNAGTYYIGKAGQWLATVDIDKDDANAAFNLRERVRADITFEQVERDLTGGAGFDD